MIKKDRLYKLLNNSINGVEKINQNKFFYLLGYYSILFVIIFIGAFYPFLRNEKTFHWTSDAVRIHYPSMHYIGTHIRDIILEFISTGKLNIPLFDISIGYGHDIIQYLGVYYLEPINLISVLVKSSHMELLYDILVVTRIYFTGISFMILGYYKKADHFGILCGALVYTFSGYVFFAGPRHPIFQTMMCLLPLLIYGMERIINGNSFLTFSLIVAYSAISSWYCLYINSVIMAIYFGVYFVFPRNDFGFRKTIKLAGKLLSAYLLGISLSSIILIPSIIAFFNSGRHTSTIITDSLFYYDTNYNYRNLFYMFSPRNSPGNWTRINCVVWGIFCVFNSLFLFNKYKTKRCNLIFYVLLLIGTFIPLFGFIMSGFSSINNRWSFAFLLAVALITMEESTSLIQNNIISLKAVLYGCILFIGSVILTNRNVQNQYSFIGIILLLFTFCSLFLVWDISKKHSDYRLKIEKIIVLFVISLNGIILGRFTFSEYYGDYIREFTDKGKVYSSIIPESRTVAKKINKDTFFRIDFNDISLSNSNAAMLANYYGISEQFNEIDKNLIDLLCDNGIALYNSNNIGGLNQRTILSTLANVRYFVQNKKSKDKRVPYGYSLIEEQQGFNIYENTCFLPLGYTYDQYVKNEEYQKLDCINKQYALLNGVVLEEYEEKFSSVTIENLAEQIQYTLKGNNISCKPDSNEYSINKKNGELLIEFTAQPNTETLLLLDGINVDHITKGDLKLSVSCGLGNYTVNIRSKYDIYRLESDGKFLINLGCLEEGIQTCTITFPTTGNVFIDDIKLYSCSMEPYAEKIEKLREEPLENIVIGTNRVTGNINLSKNKILCLGIPYSTGWTAFVDGKETKLFRANTMYMAIPLEAGFHTIELKYFTPGLKAGIIITISSLLFIAFMLYFKKNYKKLSRYFVNKE